ncbi:hypothetical protein PR003_g4091 [Phytophthora rubi]|uniref:Uncharacterized protein n=1 Tax=Phytophthora rubi TaxID=129364 RepID=A0A6A3JNN3_9STRA|nr:hypothetical protein PR002_g19344 [Phytophthora rubi]KAE8999544.1 hypothetical protein PR001_g19027 [Phytophthora rubi]KAE9353007.1 hypothetical protein PR003_g4091 [Phytophthora rubi]
MLKNRYRHGRQVLPGVMPFVRLPVSSSTASDTPILNERSAKRRRRDGDAASTHTEVESSPACAGAPAALPLGDIGVPPSTAMEDRPLQCRVNTPHVTWTEADDREGERELRPSNSGPTVESFPTKSRGASPSVGEGMDGEVTRRGGLVEVTSGDDLAEDDGNLDDLEDKAPIAFGEPASSMDEVADAISDSGSEDDVEMNDTAESFRRSTRTRWPNSRYRDYEVELPMSLVIETVNSLMDPETVDNAFSGPDAEKWVEVLEKEYV